MSDVLQHLTDAAGSPTNDFMRSPKEQARSDALRALRDTLEDALDAGVIRCEEWPAYAPMGDCSCPGCRLASLLSGRPAGEGK